MATMARQDPGEDASDDEPFVFLSSQTGTYDDSGNIPNIQPATLALENQDWDSRGFDDDNQAPWGEDTLTASSILGEDYDWLDDVESGDTAILRWRSAIEHEMFEQQQLGSEESLSLAFPNNDTDSNEQQRAQSKQRRTSFPESPLDGQRMAPTYDIQSIPEAIQIPMAPKNKKRRELVMSPMAGSTNFQAPSSAALSSADDEADCKWPSAVCGVLQDVGMVFWTVARAVPKGFWWIYVGFRNDRRRWVSQRFAERLETERRRDGIV